MGISAKNIFVRV